MHYDANGSPVDGPGFTDPPTHVSSAPKSHFAVRSLFSGFSFLGETPFPEHLCVVPGDSVMDSTDSDYHVVVLVDSRFSNSAYFQVMRPYTSYDPDEKETLYGWVAKNGNLVSHGEHPAYDPDDAKVVAWKPCPKDFDLRA